MAITQMNRVHILGPERHQVFVHEENLAGDRPPAAYKTEPTSLGATHLIASTRSSSSNPATLTIGVIRGGARP